MSWDDLEPGQDDLVKDGRARKKIKRAVRNARPGLSDEEALYTDHNAGDPRRLTPNAERVRPQSGRGEGPVRGGFLERFRSSMRSLREAWDEAYRDAQDKQQLRQQERQARRNGRK